MFSGHDIEDCEYSVYLLFAFGEWGDSNKLGDLPSTDGPNLRQFTATDGKSNSTSYVYDARGRQKSQTDRLSGTTSFTYLATGQLASLTDAESQTTSYTYDDVGQKLTEQYPDHTGGSPGSSSYGIVTFTNDAAGRVLRKQDQLGDTVTYNYDLAGRLTSRDYRTRVNSPSGTIADSDTFTYDKASRMLTAVSGRYSNTVTYAYDNGGRKSSESLTIGGQTYTTLTTYDDKGQLTGYTYPDGTSVERTYTDRGQLHQLKHAGTTIDTRTYDNGGRMTGSSYNNGVSETRAYNTDNTLASISYSGAAIGNMSYSWDDNKNKTGETITGTMSGYGFSVPSSGYDDEDRLVTFNRTDGNLDQSWSLSAVGDWNSITTEGTAQARTHGPTHELTAVAGNSVSTDVKGNITLIPSAARPTSSSLALEWDFDNRLKAADIDNNGSDDVTYQFDALGRRVARTASGSTTVYVQSGQQTIADYVSGAASSARTFATFTVATSTNLYSATNPPVHRVSTTTVTSSIPLLPSPMRQPPSSNDTPTVPTEHPPSPMVLEPCSHLLPLTIATPTQVANGTTKLTSTITVQECLSPS